MKLNPNQLAAIWLCYTTNSHYRTKLNRPMEEIREDENFLALTGLDPDVIEQMKSRIDGDALVMAALESTRAAFLQVFKPIPKTPQSFWDDSSPSTALVKRITEG